MAIPPKRGWSDANERRAREAGHEDYSAWVRAVEREVGHPVCGAWARSAGRPCKQWQVEANQRGRCRTHKGGEQRGAANSQAKHLQRSEHMPAEVLGRVEALRESDPLDLTGPLGVLYFRMEQLLDRAVPSNGDAGASASLEGAREALDLLDRAVDTGEARHLRAARRELEDAVGGAEAERSTWREVRDVADEIRRMVGTANRVRKAESEAMTRRELADFGTYYVMRLMRAVQEVVGKYEEEHGGPFFARLQRDLIERFQREVAVFRGQPVDVQGGEEGAP